MAEHAVDVERLGVEVHVEPLGEDHLEHVSGEDVLPRRLDCGPVEHGTHAGRHLRRLVIGIGWLHEGLVERTGPVAGQDLQAGDRFVIGGVQRRIVCIVGHDHVHDEHGPLAPVVDRHQFAYDRHHPVREALVVGRYVRKVLDLPHHVVPQVAHQPAVQGRHALDGR